MRRLLSNLGRIASFRANDALEQKHAIELIDLKIRDSEQSLSVAKSTLASIIMRQRNEAAAISRIKQQVADLETRAKAAIAAKNKNLSADAAQVIADLENEKSDRERAYKTFSEKRDKIQLSIEKAHRRIINLRQGANVAKATMAQQNAQTRLDRSIGNTSTFKEAEDLIARVAGQSDPFEESHVLDEIDEGLNQSNISNRLAEAGFGAPTRTSAEDVLARLSN